MTEYAKGFFGTTAVISREKRDARKASDMAKEEWKTASDRWESLCEKSATKSEIDAAQAAMVRAHDKYRAAAHKAGMLGG
jgi:hypothetical protein